MRERTVKKNKKKNSPSDLCASALSTRLKCLEVASNTCIFQSVSWGCSYTTVTYKRVLFRPDTIHVAIMVASWGTLFVRGLVARWPANANVAIKVTNSSLGRRSKLFLYPLAIHLRIVPDFKSPRSQVGLVVVWLQYSHVARGS